MENSQNVEQAAVSQPVKKSNGIGTAGFVVALIALIFCWVPILGWILWAIGLILSIIGVFKRPKGLAFAGLGISLIGIIIMIVLFAGLAASM